MQKSVAFICVSLMIIFFAFSLPVRADLLQTASVSEETNQLQSQLQEIEKQIQQYQSELKTVQGQKNTLQNKVNALKKQQVAVALQMKATSLELSSLSKDLAKTQTTIDEKTKQISDLRERIADVVRYIDEQDRFPLLFTFVQKGSFSAMLDEIASAAEISNGLTEVLDLAKKTKTDLEADKLVLTDQQDEMNSLLNIQTLQQQQITGNVSEQNVLLKETKGKESAYQATLSDTKKRASQIRTRLYQLLDVSTQITFGEAVKIASWASTQTSVRASFLLAILTQESNLGKNVGTCNRLNDPPEKSWKVIMKPTRDQEPFKTITSELGRDPDVTPVSCPMRDKKGNQVGWGGAMGPAQFIPSTWMGYRDKITAITGKAADPWDIRDAFLASAIKLKADGAGSESGEWAAAMKYFSGSTNTRFRFYGDNVVATAEKYQNDIEALGSK